MPGKLVISLDFEGMWGSLCSKDQSTIDAFRKRVAHIQEYVPKMLDLFTRNQIHVTWAVVGAMFCENGLEAKTYLPDDVFYSSYNLSLHDYLDQIGKDEEGLYFVRELVEEVMKVPNQEIGCHTFSHIYAAEEGMEEKLIDQDLTAFSQITQKYDRKPQSIVMPRNMVHSPYLPLLARHGFHAVRGRQKPAIKWSKSERNKLIDFIDCYFPIRRDLCYDEDDIEVLDGLYNVRASMYFRTYDQRFGKLENLKIGRIKREMLRAAEAGKIFHLWWHPHNMATNIEWNFDALEKLLSYYVELQEKYSFESRNIGEIVQERNERIK